MTSAQKNLMIRLLVSGGGFFALFFLEKSAILPFSGTGPLFFFFNLLPYLFFYLIAGYDTVKDAFLNLFHGHLFDENFLMLVATLSAFLISENLEGLAVMVFFKVGALFENIAVHRSREAIKEMMSIAPESANLYSGGEVKEVDPEDLSVDDVILIKPGEKIPVDSVCIEGESLIDTSSLTGESVPRSAYPGTELISGCINGNGTLKAKVRKVYADSSVSRILELMENATAKKTKVENFITRFARIYTPVVTLIAVVLMLLPPLLFSEPFPEWIRRGCIFLVISCPCALVISVPMGFFAGIGHAGKKGVLVKGSNYFEILAKVKTIVFDKTGTLTKGVFHVIHVTGSEETLTVAAALEKNSTHPLAEAILSYYAEQTERKGISGADSGDIGKLPEVTELRAIPGKGLLGKIGGKEYAAGNRALMAERRMDVPEEFPEEGTTVYVSSRERYLGRIVISDEIKENAEEALSEIRKHGIKKTVILSGDRKNVTESIGKKLGIDQVFSELLPEDKAEKIGPFLKEKDGFTAFVGDGMNDAPALLTSDLGIAMGALGSDAAISAADVVLMDDDLMKLADTVLIAKKTLRIVRENIIVSLAVKFAVLLLGAFGLAPMAFAIFADVGVLILAILNSMRAMR